MHKVKGTCIWFNEKMGYGFLKSDDGNDCFVHYKNIKEQGFKTLFRGQRVTYNEVETEKGLQATQVKYEKCMEKLEGYMESNKSIQSSN